MMQDHKEMKTIADNFRLKFEELTYAEMQQALTEFATRVMQPQEERVELYSARKHNSDPDVANHNLPANAPSNLSTFTSSTEPSYSTYEPTDQPYSAYPSYQNQPTHSQYQPTRQRETNRDAETYHHCGQPGHRHYNCPTNPASRCFNCNQMGHWGYECPRNKRSSNGSNTIQQKSACGQ